MRDRGPCRCRPRGVGPCSRNGPGGPARGLVARPAGLETGRYGLAETCLERASPGEAERRRGAAAPGPALLDDRPARGAQSMLQRDVERMRDPSETLRDLWKHRPDPIQVDASSWRLGQGREVGPRRRPRLARAGRPGDPHRAVRGGRRMAHALRAGAARRPCRLARTGSNGPRPPAGPTRSCGRRATCRSRLTQARRARAARLAGRAEWRPPGRATALESLLALEPADAAAVERLADLAAQDGETGASPSCGAARPRSRPRASATGR